MVLLFFYSLCLEQSSAAGNIGTARLIERESACRNNGWGESEAVYLEDEVNKTTASQPG